MQAMRDLYFSQGVERLLQATFASDVVARAAFQAWVDECDLDHLPWAEMRLLPLVCENFERVEPPASLRPRLAGVAKQVWTRSQLLVAESAQAIRELDLAEVPTMLIKGAALCAEGAPLARRRILGDVDILVPPHDFERGLETLLAAGWKSARGLSGVFLRQIARRRAGINLVRGERGQIDLHHVPLHFSRHDPDLERAVWNDARRTALAGHPVTIPDRVDMLAFALGHSAGSVMGDWVVEFILRLREPDFDWSRFANRVSGRGIAPLVEPRLDWLEAKLSQDVNAARHGMREARSTFAERLKARSVSRTKADRTLVEGGMGLVADLLLQSGYSLERKERDDVRVLRPKVRFVERPSSALSGRHRIERSKGVTASVSLVFRSPPIKRKVMFELIFDDHVSRLLRGRVAPGRSEWIEWSVELPSDWQNCSTIEVIAVPIGQLDGDAASERIEQAEPIDFALTVTLAQGC